MITLKSFHCRYNRGKWRLTYELSRYKEAEEFVTVQHESLKDAMLCLMDSINQLPAAAQEEVRP